MAQQHRIVNLSKKQVLDPKLVGSPRSFGTFAFTDSPAMGGLLHLLANDWFGDRVAIVSNRAADSDLPIAEEVCGIPASQLCFPTAHGHDRFKNVSKKVREALASNYGYRFRLSNTVTTTISDQGVEEVTNSSVQSLGTSGHMFENTQSVSESFCIVNHDKDQLIHSLTFSSYPSLRAAIANTWDEDGLHSWLPTALAVLLATSMEGSPFFVEGFSGTWAGDRISIEDPGSVDTGALTDISAGLDRALEDTSEINYRLTPEVDSEDDDDEDGFIE